MKVVFTREDAEKMMNDNSSGNIIIPEGVTAIENYAFAYCTSLTSVTIPEGVTYICDGAFAGCRSLTSVTIPEGVTCINSRTFEGCTSLTSVTIPEGVTCISPKAFCRCTSLLSVTIPNSINRIFYFAFEGCSSLTSVSIDKDIMFDYCAFLKCNALQLTDQIKRSDIVECLCCRENINTRKDACLRIIPYNGYEEFICLKCGRHIENPYNHRLVCEDTCYDCPVNTGYVKGTEWINT